MLPIPPQQAFISQALLLRFLAAAAIMMIDDEFDTSFSPLARRDSPRITPTAGIACFQIAIRFNNSKNTAYVSSRTQRRARCQAFFAHTVFSGDVLSALQYLFAKRKAQAIAGIQRYCCPRELTFFPLDVNGVIWGGGFY